MKCNTSAYFLEWSFSGIPETRTFQIDGGTRTTSEQTVHSTVLNISKSQPLISTISTDTTTADFNETVITCSGKAINSALLSSERVQVIVVRNNDGNDDCKQYCYAIIIIALTKF